MLSMDKLKNKTNFNRRQVSEENRDNSKEDKELHRAMDSRWASKKLANKKPENKKLKNKLNRKIKKDLETLEDNLKLKNKTKLRLKHNLKLRQKHNLREKLKELKEEKAKSNEYVKLE